MVVFDVGGKEIKVPIHSDLTDIAGLMTEEEIQTAVEEVREKFSGRVAGFCNEKPAEYELEVYPYRGNRVILGDKLVGNYMDYLPPESIKYYERSYGRYGARRYLNVAVIHRYALLFPQHRVALILEGWRLKDVPNGKKHLEDLGYTFAHRIESNYSDRWNFTNRLELFKALRKSKNTDVRAIDRRTTQILDLLTENLSEEPLSYTFGVFAYSTRKAEDYPVIVFENKVNPIKKAVEVPVGWRNNKLEEIGKGLAMTKAIGLTSKVQTKNGIKHIPMVDFSRDCRRPENVLKQLNMPGILVVSGHSYHFYGFELMEEKEWKVYTESLKDNFRFGAYGVCEHWPDLQLKQGFSMLRITPCRTRLFQPCYMETFTPDRTGTDEDTKTEKRGEPLISIAA